MNLRKFIQESNHIEGIYGDPSVQEISAYKIFLGLPDIMVDELESFVSVIQPNVGKHKNQIRRTPCYNVRVGNYIAPAGGPEIEEELRDILKSIKTAHPFHTHQRYEKLHPFLDGNGRSGRAIWLWMMLYQDKNISLGFLHSWYYQSLENWRSCM